MRRLRDPHNRRLLVVALTVLLLLASVVLGLRLPAGGEQHPQLRWELIALAYAVSEIFVVHVQVRRQSLSFSVAEVAAVVGLVFVGPRQLVLACMLGSAVGLFLQRRQGVSKLAFNLSLFTLESVVAVTVFHSLADVSAPTSFRTLAAAALAVQVGVQVNNIALSAVISITSGRLDWEPLVGALLARVLIEGAATCIGLLVVVLVVKEPVALVLLAGVVLLVLWASRAYSRLDWRHRRVEALYTFTKAVSGIDQLDPLAEAILRAARDTLHCDIAELMLAPTPSFAGAAREMRASGELTVLPAPSPLGTLAVAGRRVLLPRGSDQALDLGLPANADAISIPLTSGGQVFGTLSVAARWPYLPAFSDEDVQLFSSLCDHAAVTLQGALLIDQIRENAAEREYQALHDTVTQLPNRRALIETAARRSEELRGSYAILALDLLGFSDVNDTLGHVTGDLLLHEVGRRLLWNSSPGHVARLGNDEFAVLLPDVDDARQATLAARAVLRPLQEPFALQGLTLDVRVNAGLAISWLHGTDPTMLSQKADVALAVAKREDAPLHLYDVQDDVRGSRRLQLVSDLRLAVAAETVEVYYQPKLDPSTGRVVGAEALARWQHPTEGYVSPDEFIPLAEHAGLIRELTSFVLRTALAECVRWRRAGHDMTIAVNVSPRILTDEQLPIDVAEALARVGLPPHALTLEITETAVMSDVATARRVLESLHSMGIALSLDDFGTGHSSLSYLATLPVHEVKLDKSFTLGLPHDPSALAIVRSTIALGHELGLSVVAEGVERDDARSLLAEWNCDVVQGYFYTRPLPLGPFDAWLNEHSGAGLTLR